MKFFNTDGIRARALDLICSNLCLRLGQVLGKRSKKILIGYDTRISSPQIVDLLINGIVTQGADMEVLGVMPTPMMSFLLPRHPADYGIVVTASHNPYYDNGIKVFASSGEKIDARTIGEIEKQMEEEEKFSLMGNLGKLTYLSYHQEYIDDLNAKIDFQNPHKVVVDLANGAFSSFQNVLYLDRVDYIHALPDGRNINDGVGRAVRGKPPPIRQRERLRLRIRFRRRRRPPSDGRSETRLYGGRPSLSSGVRKRRG